MRVPRLSKKAKDTLFWIEYIDENQEEWEENSLGARNCEKWDKVRKCIEKNKNSASKKSIFIKEQNWLMVDYFSSEVAS